MATENAKKFEAANAEYAKKFAADGHGQEPMPPARKVKMTMMMLKQHKSLQAQVMPVSE